MIAIAVTGLTKTYWYYEKETGLPGALRGLFRTKRTPVEAVRDLNFEVGLGEVVGLIGPNGAGKTTTLKMLCSILHPLEGRLATVPQRKLSFGQRKRCELAATLLHDPKVILLDEPTNAMDLLSAGRVRQFIREEAREGNRAVIITSHNMADIESVCERVTILDKGRILYDGLRRNLSHADRPVKRIHRPSARGNRLRVQWRQPWTSRKIRSGSSDFLRKGTYIVELIVLGSGTAVPHPKRGSAGYLVRSGGRTILVDVGLGTLQKLAVLGISLAEPDAAAFTHLHLDHIAELPPLLFALRNCGVGRTKTLTLLGAPGFRDFCARLRRMYGDGVEPLDYVLEIEEIDGRPVSLGGFTLRAFPVSHTPQSVAYRVEDPADGKTIAFSGDTDVCEGLVEAARGADLAVFECSFPEGRKAEGHLTPGEAGEIASRSGAKRLLLTHFYPECEGADILGQCRRRYAGEILLAEDLLRISV